MGDYGMENYSTHYPSKKMYITPKLIVEATCGEIDNSYEPYIIRTQNDIDKVMVYVEDSMRSNVNALISTMSTVGGVMIMFWNPKDAVIKGAAVLLGNGITIMGGTTVGYAWLEDIAIEDVQMALKDGNMYIDYCIYEGSQFYNNYNSWTSNQYINKLVYGNPGRVGISLTYQEVQMTCGLKNYDN